MKINTILSVFAISAILTAAPAFANIFDNNDKISCKMANGQIEVNTPEECRKAGGQIQGDQNQNQNQNQNSRSNMNTNNNQNK